jgi:ATP-dependent exoDNAse (exonuclease V) alpha subunit
MTFNKAQGQEWERVLADIRKYPFTHGHLYVVLSRIRQSANIKFFCTENQTFEGCPFVTNVVYNKLKIHVK